MQMDDMILVSVDDHVCEPADMWDRHWEGRETRPPGTYHVVMTGWRR